MPDPRPRFLVFDRQRPCPRCQARNQRLDCLGPRARQGDHACKMCGGTGMALVGLEEALAGLREEGPKQ